MGARHSTERCSVSQPCCDTGSMIIAPVLQSRNLGLREVKYLSQGRTANGWPETQT